MAKLCPSVVAGVAVAVLCFMAVAPVHGTSSTSSSATTADSSSLITPEPMTASDVVAVTTPQPDEPTETCAVVAPLGCVDPEAIANFFPSADVDGQVGWMKDSISLMYLEGNDETSLGEAVAAIASSRSLEELNALSSACENIELIPDDYRYCSFDASSIVESLGAKVPDKSEAKPLSFNPFGVCAAFHVQNQILSFGLDGILKFPSKPGELEITEFAMSGKKCMSEEVVYWDGGYSSAAVSASVNVGWHLAMAAKYSFGFEAQNGNTKISANLEVQGKLYIDLDFNNDGTIVEPTNAIKQMIGPLANGQGNADAADFAVLITGEPSSDLTFQLTKKIQMTFKLDEWVSANAHFLLVSRGPGNPLTLSAKMRITIGSLDALLDLLVKQSLAAIKEAACNVFKFLQVIPQIRDFCEGDGRRFWRRAVDAGIDLHVSGVDSIRLRVEGLSDKPFIMAAGAQTQGLVFCLGDTCSKDTCMSDDDCGPLEWCDNSKLDTVGNALEPNKCKPLLNNGDQCTDFASIGGRSNACRSGICCTTCQHPSCCSEVCDIGRANGCASGRNEDEGGVAKCCIWGNNALQCSAGEAEAPENECGDQCKKPSCFARSTLACRRLDPLASPTEAYHACQLPMPTSASLIAERVLMTELSGGDYVLSALIPGSGRSAGSSTNSSLRGIEGAAGVELESLFFDRVLVNQHKYAVWEATDLRSGSIWNSETESVSKLVSADVISLYTASGDALVVTPDHMVVLDGRLRPAREARAGSEMTGVSGTEVVVGVSITSSVPIVNPLTSTGTILAFPSATGGAVLASTYVEWVSAVFAAQPLRSALVTQLAFLFPDAAQSGHDLILEPFVNGLQLPSALAPVPAWAAPLVWLLCDACMSVSLLFFAMFFGLWHAQTLAVATVVATVGAVMFASRSKGSPGVRTCQ